LSHDETTVDLEGEPAGGPEGGKAGGSAVPLGSRPRSESPRPPAPGEDPLVGRTISGCDILEWIGRGGMGAVYRARQVSLDRLVAFKVIGEGARRNESLLSRFQREAKMIARFNSSRIVQVYEVGYDQGIHFISMEYVPGGDLKKHTRKLGRVAPRQALLYMRQAAEGLLAAERQKIIHRDLKPENLMLDAAGEIKITDFGLAKTLQADSSLTQMGDSLVTPIYMSPEQAQGITLDHRSDIYSLGAAFFFILTGAPPCMGSSVYEILKKKTEVEFLDPAGALEKGPLEPGIRGIIRRMTALQPRDRYPSFRDLIEDIDRCLSGQRIGRGKRRSLKRRLRPLAAAALLAGGIAAGMRFMGLLPVSAGSRSSAHSAPSVPSLSGPGAATAFGPVERPAPVALGSAEEEIDWLKERVKALPEPEAGEPPFRDLARRLTETRKELEPPPGAPGDLKGWLEAEARSRSTGLEARAEAAAREALRAAQSKSEEVARSAAALPDLEASTALLEESKKNLSAAFPGSAERWEKALPGAALAEIRGRIAKRVELETELRALSGGLKEASGLLDSIQTSADWKREEGRFPVLLSGLARRIEALREREPQAPLKEPETGLQTVLGRRDRWAGHLQLLEAALGSLEAHRLGQLSHLLLDLKRDGLSDSQVEAVEAARKSLLEGFESVLERLEFPEARERFRGAEGALARAGLSTRYPAACLRRLEELEKLVTGRMAPIPGGEVKIRGEPVVKVDSFFLDRYEVSIKGYRKFLAELKQMGPEEARRFWPTAEVFARDAGEPHYLASFPNIDEDWPVEAVNYFQARAYLTWSRRELPTLAEWWLAAKGPLRSGHRQYPCELWEIKRAGHPAPVDRGAASVLHNRPQGTVHHLSGNVAEWTEVQKNGTAAELVGGSYRDSNDRIFSGEISDRLELSEARRGYGFRGVIRPRCFFEGLIPDEGSSAR
jgi:formylglycine-generating enzyme required for sulfatase activity/predicted Ser/Thr protein kinase